MARLRVLIPRRKLQGAVRRLARAVRRDYSGQPLVLVGILKGAFVFLADLVRALDMPIEVDFVQAASYGSGQTSPGQVRLLRGIQTLVRGKHVLLVEDIADTGLTLSFMQRYLRRRGALSVKVCSLLDKPSRRRAPVTIEYAGFTVPNVFVVGYGIDWNEQYRHLPDVCALEEV